MYRKKQNKCCNKNTFIIWKVDTGYIMTTLSYNIVTLFL